MNLLAIVVRVEGQVWARGADGELRVLAAGDRLARGDSLVAAPGARVDLDFGSGRLISLLGEQDLPLAALEPQAVAAPAAPVDALTPAAPSSRSGADAPRQAPADGSALPEGHGFVQLVRIGEIIEADGYTPVTLARIQELIRPLGMSLPDTGIPAPLRYGPAEDRAHETSRPAVPGAPTPDPDPVTPPTLDVVIHADGSVSFIFSRPPLGFELDDVQVSHGRIVDLRPDPEDPTRWIARLIPDANFEGTVMVSVADGRYTDRDGVPGSGDSDSVIVDTLPPTVTVTIGDGTVTFDFSEPPQGFDAGDVIVDNGRIENLRPDPSSPTRWTADLIPDTDHEGTVVVRVPDGSYTDDTGNPGGGDQDEIDIGGGDPGPNPDPDPDPDPNPNPDPDPNPNPDPDPDPDPDNRAPTAGAPDGRSNLDADEVSVPMAGVFRDPDGDPLTYAAAGLPPGLGIDPATGLISGKLTHDASQGGPGGNGVYTVTVTATDPSGASVSRTFEWFVGNPPPVAVSDGGLTNEDTVLVVGAASGVLSNDRDPDGDPLVVSAVNGVPGQVGQPVAGSNGGQFVLQPDGSYRFDPRGEFEHLQPGQSATTSITYTISDGEGGTSTATLTITVTGLNDGPAIAGPGGQSGTLVEAGHEDDGTPVPGTPTASGQFTASDVDGGAPAWSVSGPNSGTYGTFALDPATGAWTYTLDNGLPATQALREGQTVTQTYVVRATDAQGAYDERSVTLTIHGTNDAPVITNDATQQAGAVSEAGHDATGNPVAGTPVATGQLTASDVDAAETQTWTVTGGDGATYGHFVVDSATGAWTYTLDNDLPATQALNEGQTVTQSYTVRVTDAFGAWADQVVVITITGTNDQPVTVGEVPDQENPDAGTVDLDVTSYFDGLDADSVLEYDATGLPPGLSIDPDDGRITGTLDADASQGGPNNDGVYEVTVTVTDPEGETTQQTFTWVVTNPPPVADDDDASGPEDTVVSGDLLTNDEDPDGDALSVTQFEVGGQIYPVTPATPGQVTIPGVGTLEIDSDGHYTFTPVPDWNGDVPTVTYTISDGEGGTDTAELNITITPINDPPAITGLASDSVYERGLPAGTTANDGSAVVNNTFTLSAPDGIQSLAISTGIGTETFTLEQLEGATPGAPLEVTTDHGVLAITGFTSTGIGTGTISYTYTLTDPADHSGGTVTEDFGLLLTDDDGDTQPATLTITVVDDQPQAVNDVDEVINLPGNPSSVATGNVFTGVDGSGGDVNLLDGSADAMGADVPSAPVSGVVAGSGTPLAANVGSAIDGAYGTLTLNDDGSYTYTPDYDLPAVAGLDPEDDPLEDVFTYQITDADGSTATAMLTVRIVGTPAILGLSSGTVYEAALATGSSNDPDDDREVHGGNFQLVTPNGLATLTVTGSGPSQVLTPTLLAAATPDDPIIVPTAHGVLEITGYDATSGTVTYQFTLLDPADHSGGGVSDTLTLEVRDLLGDGGTRPLTITIVDDGPRATADTASIHEDAVPDTVEGNVLDYDHVGADPNTDPVTAVSFDGTPGTLGQPLAGEYGRLVLNADGTWTYTLDNDDPAVQALPVGGELTEIYTYEVTDGDGDAVTQTLTITIHGANDRPVAVDDLSIVGVGHPVSHDVVANDTDHETSNDDLRVTEVGGEPIVPGGSVTLTGIGTVTLGLDGQTLTLVPDPGVVGQVVVPYTVDDGSGTANSSDSADWVIHIIAVDIFDDASPADPDVGDNVLASIDDLENVRITGWVPVGSTTGDFTVTVRDGDGNEVVVPAANISIDPDGSFTATADLSGLDDGSLSVTLEATDAGGNTATTGDTILKDTVTPVDIDPLVVVNGAITVITGTGEPDAQVEISIGGTTVTTVTVAPDGTWTYTPAAALTADDFEIVADATDPYGNTNSSARDVPSLSLADLNGGDAGHLTVYESGLADGSDPAGPAASVAGTFTLGLSGTDTLDHVRIGGTLSGTTITGGTPVSLTDLGNATPGAPVVVNTVYGELRITGYDAGTGVVSYTYLIDDNTTAHSSGAGNDTVSEAIPVAVVDADGDTRIDVITAVVVDDVPEAVNDPGVTVTEGGAVAGSGIGDGENLLTNDVPGADGARVHQIRYTNVDGDSETATILAGSSEVVTTQYGSLTVHSDGTWSYSVVDYARHPIAVNAGEWVEDPFEYTLIDADGDVSNWATQPIRVDDTVPVVGTPVNATVDEAHLPTGSDPDGDELSVTRSLDIDRGADPLDGTAGLVFDEDATRDALNALNLTSGGESLSYTVSADGTRLEATANGRPIFTVTLDATGSGTYTFLLQGSLNHGGDDDIELPFHFTVTDWDADADTGSFTVNVLDDTPPPVGAPVNVTVDEDQTVTFNTSADANSTNTVILDADGVPAPVVGGPPVPGQPVVYQLDYGTATVNANGTVTYTPNPDYSGSEVFQYQTDIPGEALTTSTVTATVRPVSDAPGLSVDGAVQTPEDVAVALGLNKPVITDDTDDNGTDPGSGDNPERIGLITLTGIPAGAQLLDGTNGNALLHNATGGAVTVLISDDPALHTASPGTPTLTLTTAQFEALQILPPAHAHQNFTITVSATSYEVDDANTPRVGVPGATSTLDVPVRVLAVTDAIDLLIDGAKTHDATIDEDTTLDLDALLGASFLDLDGSEERWITIDNPAGNAPIVVNGQTVAAGGSITIPAPGLSTSTTGLPQISIGGQGDFSGDLEGITVTLHARDRDGDAGDPNGSELTSSVTLNLYVDPVAGDVAVQDVSTTEDTAVAFLAGVSVTDGGTGSTGSERITVVSFEVPAGWTITQSAAGHGTTWTGGQVGSTDTYTITALGSTNLEDLLGDFRILPPAHSSADAVLALSITSEDTNTVNGNPQVSTETVSRDLHITVTPVAEVVGTDTAGPAGDDLTMTPGHTYATAGEEDTWFELNREGFDLSDGWANEDSDEQTFALLTPEVTAGDGSQANANGAQFRYHDGAGWITQTFTGTAVQVPMEFLDTLEFMAPPHFAGRFTIGVQALTVDTDPDTGAEVTAISGAAELVNVLIEPVADELTLAVNAIAPGLEDTPIPLVIKPQSSDPSEIFEVTITGIPDGAVLVYGGTVIYAATDTSGEVLIEDFDRNLPLTIQAPENFNGEIPLDVFAQSVDRLVVDGVPYEDRSDIETLPITVRVQGVADDVIVTLVEPNYLEAALDSAGGRVDLSDLITGTGLVDNDGSETLTLRITGLPEGIGLSGGAFLGGEGEERAWLFTLDQLADAQLILPANFSGTLTASLTPITTENDGHSDEWAEQELRLTVTPSPEATLNPGTALLEDTSTPLVFALQPQNGDNDETLTAVWINRADVDGNPDFTLTLGAGGPVLSAAGLPTDGSGEWYVLSGTDLGNVHAQGAANLSGSPEFRVRYEVTDPSQDGTLPSVTTLSPEQPYRLDIAAVTDPATLVITGIAASNGNAVITGDSVEASGNTALTVSLTLSKNPDANAGGARDYDGSERLTGIVIDGVPPGVTIPGATYIGNIEQNENTGRWLMNVDPAQALNGAHDFDIVFELDGMAAVLGDFTGSLTITAITRDGSADEHRAPASWDLQTAPVGEFDDSGVSGLEPAQIDTWADAPAFVATEDEPFTLDEAVQANIVGSSDFAVTLTGLPPGTVVSGMTFTVVDGVDTWTASGSGDDSALQALLAAITLTAPPNANDNNTASFAFEATLTTYAPNGERNDAVITVAQPVTPVTDPAVLNVTAPDVPENTDVHFTIAISNPADGAFSQVIGGNLYLQVSADAAVSGGVLLDDQGNPLGTEINPPGLSGTYYVVPGVAVGDTVEVVYDTPVNHGTGEVTLQSWIVTQESGAAGQQITPQTTTAQVLPVNSGFDFTVSANAVGDEDTDIRVDVSGSLVDTDNSETVLSMLLRGLPNGFLVLTGPNADGTGATLASNAGNNDWSIPVSGGVLPAYIAIRPPLNWNGEIPNLTLIAYTGEATLGTTAQSTATFDLLVNPVVDGITLNPTHSFGPEGQIVPLNLNVEVPDEGELVTLTVQGLGQGAAFHANGVLLSAQPGVVSYDTGTDTYTLSGLSAAQVDDLGFVQSAITGTLTVTAYTTDGAVSGELVPGTDSATVSVNVSPQLATSGNDVLLYSGSPLNGLGGVDTVQLRYGEDLDGATAGAHLRNIEILDLTAPGADHAVTQLRIEDVLNMTDAGNTLRINGNAGDTVTLLDDGAAQWTLTGSSGGVDIYTGSFGAQTATLEVTQGLVVD